MKNRLLIILFLISHYAYSQKATFVIGKNYEGVIFPKEHPIWGFPPESGRYTPSEEDITRAEKILQDSIGTDYIAENQRQYKKLTINKKTLRKYIRQYLGYLTSEGNVIIRVYLYRGIEMDDEKLSKDIIEIQDGGSNYWNIDINLSTKELSGMSVNGIS
ncbi:hypothetical protein [Sphingobacterium athyrii]|uniref:Uncharacterized protein n=1 Tax=Sphingobacterium athyrii TaxID=2152717 RepID=A0A363NP53_9SPHI|nr:hypothetical protein [Sphingobacterium athyrii]PUV22500.1 hypothetical protein DCO56_20015 [Sphingobacterium athyrii]